MKIEFFIPGRPIPKSRPRWSRATQRMYTPSHTGKWESEVKNKAILHRPSECVTNYAVEIYLTFFMPKPKSAPKRWVAHNRKPDIDNLAKSVLDGLQNASVFADDGQISQLTARKYYAYQDDLDSNVVAQQPGVHVLVCYKKGSEIWPKSRRVSARNVSKT